MDGQNLQVELQKLLKNGWKLVGLNIVENPDGEKMEIQAAIKELCQEQETKETV
jgi:hypothetical protein